MDDKKEKPLRSPYLTVHTQGTPEETKKKRDLSKDNLRPSDFRFLMMLDDEVESNQDLSFPGKARRRKPSYSERKW